MTRVARRDDWMNHSMPEARQAITVDRQYSPAEFERIIVGQVPQVVPDDHWFMFYEEPWFYLHRSASGDCIYQVRFESTDDNATLREAWVNRDPSDYRCTNAHFDVLLLSILLDGRAGRRTRELWDQLHATRVDSNM